MQLHIIMADRDRERLGAPDPLVYDPEIWRVSEATALYKVAGLTRRGMLDAIKAQDPQGYAALTWIALRRAGVDVRYSELDFDLLAWELDSPDEEADEPAGPADDEGNSGALPSEGPTPQP